LSIKLALTGRILVFAIGTLASQAFAWGNHSLATYRALEKMPEMSQNPIVNAESLEQFLKSEEKTLDALFDSQEAWAVANLEGYPTKPATQSFKLELSRSNDNHRAAFLSALRLASTGLFELNAQSDPIGILSTAVSSAEKSYKTPRSYSLREGEAISALLVVASATDEPAATGFDTAGWDGDPTDWGSSFNQISQRIYQFSTLSSLAFRTGHPYWGWRFAGNTLHYVQKMTQPFYPSTAPVNARIQAVTFNLLAKLGWSQPKRNFLTLRNNRSRVLDRYQAETLQFAVSGKREGPAELALRRMDKDRSYPDWNYRSLRDTVVPQSRAFTEKLGKQLVEAMPARYVNDPDFEFSAQEADIQLCREIQSGNQEARGRLDATLAELMGNFGAHSRNALRSILRASTQF
jgi:hypothetical protein